MKMLKPFATMSLVCGIAFTLSCNCLCKKEPVAQAPVPYGPPPAIAKDQPWRFAVSGDSRNCGDVVMPAIASSVLEHNVDFYWHLGDFRKMSDIDEDVAIRYGSQLTMDDYRRDGWGDFIAHQVVPFGVLPVYLG